MHLEYILIITNRYQILWIDFYYLVRYFYFKKVIPHMTVLKPLIEQLFDMFIFVIKNRHVQSESGCKISVSSAKLFEYNSIKTDQKYRSFFTTSLFKTERFLTPSHFCLVYEM